MRDGHPKRWPRASAARTASYAALILGCLFFIYPIFFSIAVGFMSKEQYATTPPSIVPLPAPFAFYNYQKILCLDSQSRQYAIWYLNPFLRAAWYVVCNVVTGFIGGYVFARMKFVGKQLVFIILMVSIMLPGVITMAPTYLLMAHFPLVGGNNILGQGGTGFIDKFPVLFLLSLVSVVSIFLVRMAMSSFPRELEEAGKIDGAGVWRIMFQIVFPIQTPILAYIAISTGISVWNDWYIPFIYTNSDSLGTIASILVKMHSGEEGGQAGIPNWPKLIATGLGLTIPSLIIFAFFQRYIVQGLSTAAVKG